MGLFSIFTRSENSKDKEKQDSKKEEKQHDWKDTNEKYKFVCEGGTAMCNYCSIPTAKIVVTSNDVSLQDRSWATIGDCDGRVNLDFKGQCLHPSQIKPPAPPPLCKMVIMLGKWKEFTETYIDDENALIVKSTIPCLNSQQDIIITHSGQKQELEEVDPLEVKGLFCPIVYFSKQDAITDKTSIFKVFIEENKNSERWLPFIKDMDYATLEEDQFYFVPYLRMWPAQKGNREFSLQCHVNLGIKESEDFGELLFELESPINGLTLEFEKKEDVQLISTFDLKITITDQVDRARTAIFDKPLIVYAINSEFKEEVGRIHLSIAPKDVFSEEEFEKYKYNIRKYRIGLIMKKIIVCLH